MCRFRHATSSSRQDAATVQQIFAAVAPQEAQRHTAGWELAQACDSLGGAFTIYHTTFIGAHTAFGLPTVLQHADSLFATASRLATSATRARIRKELGKMLASCTAAEAQLLQLLGRRLQQDADSGDLRCRYALTRPPANFDWRGLAAECPHRAPFLGVAPSALPVSGNA